MSKSDIAKEVEDLQKEIERLTGLCEDYGIDTGANMHFDHFHHNAVASIVVDTCLLPAEYDIPSRIELGDNVYYLEGGVNGGPVIEYTLGGNE
jgi:hypothetical protein